MVETAFTERVKARIRKESFPASVDLYDRSSFYGTVYFRMETEFFFETVLIVEKSRAEIVINEEPGRS